MVLENTIVPIMALLLSFLSLILSLYNAYDNKKIRKVTLAKEWHVEVSTIPQIGSVDEREYHRLKKYLAKTHNIVKECIAIGEDSTTYYFDIQKRKFEELEKFQVYSYVFIKNNAKNSIYLQRLEGEKGEFYDISEEIEPQESVVIALHKFRKPPVLTLNYNGTFLSYNITHGQNAVRPKPPV